MGLLKPSCWTFALMFLQQGLLGCEPLACIWRKLVPQNVGLVMKQDLCTRAENQVHRQHSGALPSAPLFNVFWRLPAGFPGDAGTNGAA